MYSEKKVVFYSRTPVPGSRTEPVIIIDLFTWPSRWSWHWSRFLSFQSNSSFFTGSYLMTNIYSSHIKFFCINHNIMLQFKPPLNFYRYINIMFYVFYLRKPSIIIFHVIKNLVTWGFNSHLVSFFNVLFKLWILITFVFELYGFEYFTSISTRTSF